MNIYVGITDSDWHRQLSLAAPEEINFWQPGGSANFRALKQNELFLFKLHSPQNYIVGGGFFLDFIKLAPKTAWDTFEQNNGTESYDELYRRICKYRKVQTLPSDAVIGCIILTAPFWFPKEDWFLVPGWPGNVVQGKGYSTSKSEGSWLYQQIVDRLPRANMAKGNIQQLAEEGQRYAEAITKHRLGQGGFRIEVAQAYDRRCAISGEKTWPILEAAHIKPYSELGPHAVANGLFLRTDIHKLFDLGYITVTPDLEVKVSPKLHQEFGNGKDYYKFDNNPLQIVPKDKILLPGREYLDWHNRTIFKQ